AKANNGETFTGAPWRFYHFGPWAESVYERIEPALRAIGAELKTYHSSKHMQDAQRWRLGRSGVVQQLAVQITSVFAALAISSAVVNFGSDTEKLLHHVYGTPPMLQAAPGEFLDFRTLLNEPKIHVSMPVSSPELTARQKKKRREKLSRAKELLAKRLEYKKAIRAKRKVPTPPRYDEVFCQGLEQLNAQGDGIVEPTTFRCAISDEVWKSDARYAPELS
ncbi:MAG: hypothetical protein WCR47_02870, partial [Desulfoplanes sp.]